ncbi:MAG: hypothetical protein K0S07_1137 [Chlamydiales bacterium]|nr:hypothetical protein [Chlamydiales bacterium]
MWAGEDRLHYVPGKTIALKSQSHLSILQEIPSFPLKFEARQTFDSALKGITLSKSRKGELKFHLQLKQFQLEIDDNGRHELFDTAHIDSSLYLTKLSSLIDLSLPITLDAYKLQKGALKSFYKQSPLAEEVLPESFFRSLFEQIFLLSGQKIELNQKKTALLTIGERGSLPVSLEVLSCQGGVVEAIWSGEMEKKSAPFSVDSEEGPASGSISVRISLNGRGSWHLENGLNFHVKQAYQEKGAVIHGTSSSEGWPLTLYYESELKGSPEGASEGAL